MSIYTADQKIRISYILESFVFNKEKIKVQ